MALTQEKKGKCDEDNKYTNSEAPFTAPRSSVATTPVLVNLLSTLVAEANPASAFNNTTALCQLDEMSTAGAPHPLLLLDEPSKSDVVAVPRLPALVAAKPRVPNPLTLEAKQFLTTRALRFPHNSAALVYDQRVAVSVRAVAPLPPQNRRLAQRIAPPDEKLRSHHRRARRRVERVGAPDGGALYVSGAAVIELSAYVLHSAVRAERVGAFVGVPEFLVGIRGGLDADFAGEFSILIFFQRSLLPKL